MKIFKNTYSDNGKYCGIAVDDCDYVLRNEDESIKITAVKSTMMYAAVEEVFKLFKNHITNIRLKTAYIRVLRHKRGKHYLSTIFYWNEDIPSQEDLFGVFSIYDFNDYSFDSPSTASSYCLGCSINCWKDWKTKDRRSLDSIFRI